MQTSTTPAAASGAAVPDRPARSRRFVLGLAAITLGALVLRVVFVLVARRHTPLLGDDFGYYWQARALAEGHGFLNPFLWRADGATVPYAGHPPLYPLYLAAFAKAGVTSVTGLRLASTLAGAAAVAVIGLAGRRIAGSAAGLVAAGLAAVYPNLWINDAGLVSESLAALAVAVVILAAYWFWERPNARRALLLGVALGASALCRTETVLLFPLVLGAWVLTARPRGWAERLGTAGAAVLTGALVLGPWVGRNLVAFDHPATIATGFGNVLSVANCDPTYHGAYLGYWDVECEVRALHIPPEALARVRGAPGLTAVYEAIHGDETDLDSQARRAALDYVRAHQGRAAVVALARLGRVAEVYRPSQGVRLDTFFERRGLWPSQLGVEQYFLMLPFAIWALVVMRRRRVTIAPMVAIVVTTAITVAISIGITRYRLPTDVVLVVLAGVGADAFVQWRRQRRAAGTTP